MKTKKSFIAQNKRASFLAVLAVVFLGSLILSSQAKAFLFWSRKESASIYPSKISGNWEKTKNVLGKANISEDGKADKFSQYNSAIYQDGSKSLVAKDFFLVDEEAPFKTEEEEIIEEAQTWLEENDPNFKIEQVAGEEAKKEAIPEEIDLPAAVPEEINSSESESVPVKVNSENENPEEISFWQKIQRILVGKIAWAKEKMNFEQLSKKKFYSADLKLSLAVLDKKKSEIIAETEKGKAEASEISPVAKMDDVDMDSMAIIYYSHDGENWTKLSSISYSAISNSENGGYFSYPLNFVENWEDLKKLRIRVEGIVGGQIERSIYLDSLWVETLYDEGENEEIKTEDLELAGEKENWKFSENPKFRIKSKESFLSQAQNWIMFWKDNTAVTVHLLSADGKEIELEKDKDYTIKNDSEIELNFASSKKIRPGKYTLVTIFEQNGKTATLVQDFTWGVLAINTNKSIYSPDEKGKLAMAVLDENGNMVCDADLELRITNQELEIDDLLSTDNGKIKVNEEICSLHDFTLEPDYEAEYQFGEEGSYEMELTAETDNGTYTISDGVEVKSEVPFDVERITATRIYPPSDYPVTFNILANEDFDGEIRETVPANFEISKIEKDGIKDFDEEKTEGDLKTLIWKVDIKKGDSLKLGYQFKAPNVSPEFYLLGPLKFINSTLGISFLDKIVFQEARQWQIAADDTLTLRPSAAGTYQAWGTFGSPSSHWEGTSDESDTTGVQSSAGDTTSKETENLADTAQTGTINSVTAYMKSKATAAAPTTPFSDGFEAGNFDLWTDGGTTTWSMGTSSTPGSPWAPHAGTYMAYASPTDDGSLTSDNIDMTGATSIGIDFWYMEDDLDANDNYYLYYYNGSTYNYIASLESTTEDTWLNYTETITDSQYFVSTFRVRITATSPDNGEGAFVDDVVVTKTTSGNEAAKIVWKLGATEVQDDAQTISTSAFTEYSDARTTDPDGGAWSWDDINSLEIGTIASTLGASDYIQTSEFWAVVDYTPAATITVSGYCYTDATEGTPCTDDGGDQFKVAINGAVDSGVDTAVDGTGAWSFTLDEPASGAVLVFFRDGEATESKQATTVTKYDGDGGNVDLVKMYEGQLVIGTDTGSANSAQTVSISDMDTTTNGYEYSDDPDVLYDVTVGNDLDLNMDSQLNSLYIIGSNIYRPYNGTGYDTTVNNLYFEGTLTLDSNAINVAGNLTNAGTFTSANSSTITFNGSVAQTFTTNSAAYGIVTLNNIGTDGADDNVTISGALDVNGTFNITNGDLNIDTNDPNVNTAGDVTIGANAFVTAGSGTWTFDGASQTFSDSSSGGPQDIGLVIIGPSTDTTLSTNSAMKVTKINISGDGDILYITDDTLTLTGTGTGASRPLIVNTAILSKANSTIIYTGSGSTTEVETVAYNNLTFTPSSSTTFNLIGDLSGSKSMTGALTINANATLDLRPSTTDYDLTAAGITINGTLDASDSASAISNSVNWTNAGTFNCGNSIVTFNSSSTGRIITTGGTGAGKDFYDVVFNNNSGGWIIQTNSMTVTHDLTITDIAASADSWTLDTGLTLEVDGTYTITGIETAYTKWTGSTLYINGTSQTLGARTQAAETYGTLHIGTDDDVRMWQSSASTYTVDSGASLYSMDHANVDGDLYIWGDYHTQTNDYWSYAKEFDDGSAVTRQVDVRIESSANITVDAGDTLEAVGTDVNRTTVSNQGSGGYGISVATGSPGGTINFQYTDFDYLEGTTGLNIASGAVVTSLDYTAFDNLVDSGTDAFITVDSAVISVGNKTITGVDFTNTGGWANCNVNRTGVDDTEYWDFDAHTGAFAGENYDCKDGSNEDDPGMLIWDDSTPAGITVSGSVWTDEAKTTPITDGRTVHLFVNSTDYSTTTTLSGAYSFSSVTVAAGDSVIVYLDGVAEDGSTVTLALDSTTTIDNLDIITGHISLEHRSAGPITNADLEDIDDSDIGNEDGITVDTDATFADGFELYILSGENYTPGGAVICDDFELEGTGSFIPNANAVTVSGDWEMSSSGTFTTSGTVTFDGALAQSIITGGKTFSGLTINNTGSDGADDNVTISGALDIDSTFNLTNGDLILNSGNPNVNTAGDVSIGANALVTAGSGTWTFDGGSGTHTLTDSSSGGPQNLGAVAINNGSTGNVVSTGSNIKVTTLNITADDTLDISSDTLTITGSGTPFTQSGTFTTTGSTVIYTGTSATNITTTPNNTKHIPPASGSVTYSLAGDLTSGNAMTGTLTISSGATLDTTAANSYDITLAGSWSNSGIFTRNSSVVTFNGTTAGLTIVDSGSPFYDLVFSGASGEWLYKDGASSAPTNSTTVTAGTPTFLNARTGSVSVSGSGTLNVDWYLGVHTVNAAETSTNIDTGDADITISEAGDLSAVWRNIGSDWGSAAASQTTGTGSDGKNPQPETAEAIRIREYSMTASASCPGAGCTLYRYNLQVGWVSSYGEYDYYDDYGSKYITSTLAAGTDDNVIGANWYRSTPATMNSEPTVNEPPTSGSCYVGMLEGLSFSIDYFSRDFGTITPGANPSGDVTNKLTVTTSASHGYVIYAREEQPMTCSNSAVCGIADIDDWSGTNEFPSTWSGGSFGFGYSTNDYDLPSGEGNIDRFSGPKFAGFIDTGFGDPVADRTGPSSAQDNDITYRVAAEGIQTAGPYQTSIIYVVAPTY